VNDNFWLMGNKREKGKRGGGGGEGGKEGGGCGGCVSLWNFRQTCDAFNYFPMLLIHVVPSLYFPYINLSFNFFLSFFFVFFWAFISLLYF